MKRFPFFLAASLLALASIVHAEPASKVRKIELPPETGTYKAGEGLVMVQALCITCHSTEYVESQPPMPEKYWDATVKKMKEKFGAPIPPEAMPGLVKYLTDSYGKK